MKQTMSEIKIRQYESSLLNMQNFAEYEICNSHANWYSLSQQRREAEWTSIVIKVFFFLLGMHNTKFSIGATTSVYVGKIQM